jgi:hypothetical protein
VPIRGLAEINEKLYSISGNLTLDNHLEGTWPKSAGLNTLNNKLKQNSWAMVLSEGKANLDGLKNIIR